MLKPLDITHIPQKPWVYLFKTSKDEILYIGKAKNLYKRVSQYFTPWSVRKQDMLAQADHIDFIVVENESESLYLESNLIKQHLPPFNNMLKGANAYAYIKLTRHPVPQILITRKKLNDGATYIGPKHNTKELKKFLQYLRQIIQYRTCPLAQFNQKKLCSDYYFQLCKGRCAKSDLPAPDYNKLIVSFFKGNTKPIEEKIKNLILEAVNTQNFERAAKLRDIYYQIDQFVEKQTVEFAKSITGYLLQIRKIGARTCFIILNFREGKLVDVIRHHQDSSDIDEGTMIASFASDFWDFIDQGTYYATMSCKFTKEENTRLDQLFDNFFDSYVLAQTMKGDSVMNDLLRTLQSRYHLSKFPYHIECLDISHLSGDYTSWWLPCMIGGLEEKKLYRKYKITSVKNDDYLALQEVLTRRFKLNEQNPDLDQFPDLFILDGGKGQLGILSDLAQKYPHFQKLQSQVQFAALGKGEARSTAHIGQKSKKSDALVWETLYVWDFWEIHEYSLVYDESDKLLIKLRNEAHRFANYYRKQQMKTDFQKSVKRVSKKNKS